MAGLGQKPYRARQVFEALYKQRVGTVEEITTLSGELRERLTAEGYGVGLPEVVQTAVSVDGTERYLVRMADGETVETVWMPDGDGGFGSGFGRDSAEDEMEEMAAGAEVGDGLDGGGPGTIKQQIPFGNDKPKKWGSSCEGWRPCAQAAVWGFGGAGVPTGYDLCFEPGGVCGELSVLPYGEAGD